MVTRDEALKIIREKKYLYVYVRVNDIAGVYVKAVKKDMLDNLLELDKNSMIDVSASSINAYIN